jgi:hypothetical protein
VVRHAGFEPALSRILSSRPLPIGLLTHVESRVRFELTMIDLGGRIPSAGRDMLVSPDRFELSFAV